MTREEGTKKSCINGEERTRTSLFFNLDIKHTLTIIEHEKGLFSILLDGDNICWFHTLEEAKSFWLWLKKGFRYNTEEIKENINNLF